MKKILLIILCIFAFAGVTFADVSVNDVDKNGNDDYLKEYFSYVTRKTRTNWNIPRGQEEKKVTILYKIAKNGDLLDAKVIKSSGSAKADKAALEAVKKSAPFNPLPKQYTGNNLEIQYTFGYNIMGK